MLDADILVGGDANAGKLTVSAQQNATGAFTVPWPISKASGTRMLLWGVDSDGTLTNDVFVMVP